MEKENNSENYIKNVTISENRLNDLMEFQEIVGIRFNDINLLNMSLAHSSYVNETLTEMQDNEKLEFLGDSVLALIVNEYLYKKYPEKVEGQLSKLKSIVVSEYSLASIARSIDLGDYLLLGKGERQYGGAERSAILADAMEAVLGAYYLDSGLEKAREFILPFIIKELNKINKNEHRKDYKTSLQLVVQQKYKLCPVYKTVKEEGPDHNKIFYVNVYIENEEYGTGKGNNKKSAQQKAAKKALERIKNEDP